MKLGPWRRGPGGTSTVSWKAMLLGAKMGAWSLGSQRQAPWLRCHPARGENHPS